MNIFQDLSLVSVSLQMHSQMCLFVNAVGNQDGLSQMCSPLCIFCFTSISGSSKSSPPEESHDDERLADWIKLILHSCLDSLRLNTAVVFGRWLLMDQWGFW